MKKVKPLKILRKKKILMHKKAPRYLQGLVNQIKYQIFTNCLANRLPS